MLRYRVVSRSKRREVSPEQVKHEIDAMGKNPNFILLSSGMLRLRTHDENGYHFFEIDDGYEAMI